MKHYGFCLLKNVNGFDEDELFEAVKTFHSLPDEIKRKMAPRHINPESKNIYRGYFPFFDNDPSYKEILDFGRPLDDISEWERAGCPLYEKNPEIDSVLLKDKYGIDFEPYNQAI